MIRRILCFLVIAGVCGCSDNQNNLVKSASTRSGHWIATVGNFDSDAIYVFDDDGEECGKIRRSGDGPAYDLLIAYERVTELKTFGSELWAKSYVQNRCAHIKKEQP